MIMSGKHNTFALDEKFSARVKVVLWQHVIHHGDVTKLRVTTSWSARVHSQLDPGNQGFESLLCRSIHHANDWGEYCLLRRSTECVAIDSGEHRRMDSLSKSEHFCQRNEVVKCKVLYR